MKDAGGGMKAEGEAGDSPSLGYAPTPPWDRVSVVRSEDGIEIAVRSAPFLRECVPWFLAWIPFLLVTLQRQYGVNVLDALQAMCSYGRSFSCSPSRCRLQ